MSGCGYSTRSLLLANYKTLHVEPVKNKIAFTTEERRSTYTPFLEDKIRGAIIDRFFFDGAFRIADEDSADLILKTDLITYSKDPLRRTDDSDIEEYRIYIIVSLVLKISEKDEILWEEPRFAGETTYFTIGPLAESEDTALENALVDLARRIVERTVEDW